MKKTIAILLVLCLCIGLCACGAEAQKSAEAQKADELILAIGTVSIDSEDAIVAAQTCYDALTDKQKEEVKNHALLAQAQAEYTRIVAESKIEEAYASEKWATLLTLSKEYLATYPDQPFASKAQTYKEEAIDIIDKKTIEYLKAGNLETGKMLLEAIVDDVTGADALLAEVEEYSAIAGEYTADEYSRKKTGKELPFQGKREYYCLTVTPFMTDSGEWQVQYTAEVPGLFNLVGQGCFTYTCVGNAYTNGSVAAAVELDPNIDTWNTNVIESDAIQIYSTDEGYLVVHTIFYKSSSDYEEISLNFTK